MSLAWNEYSDNSENEQDFIEPIVNEAVKLLFLRKYSSTKIAEEELIKLFQECNYKDNEIQRKINQKLQSTRVPYVVIEKPFSKSHCKDNEETVSYDKYYRNNKKAYHKKSNKQYQSGWNDYSYFSFNSNYYKSSFPYKTNNKKHNRSCKVKMGTNYYVNEGNSNHNYYQVEKEIILSDEGNETMDRETENQELIVSKTFSKVSTVSELSAYNDCKEKEPNPLVSVDSPLSVRRSTSEVISELKPKDDNTFLSNYTNYFFNKSANSLKKESQLYESKLFPGVFYTKPIEPKDKKEKTWKSVFDYYAPMIQPQN